MNKLIAENIEKISQHFGLDLRESNKCYIGKCPIHGGDNQSALNFYHIKGHTTIGNWKCNTQGCEETFGANAIGFIRGILSAKKYNSEPVNVDSITNAINRIYNKNTIKYAINVPESQYLKSGLEFPATYFQNRGYSPETLMEFKVGYCSNPQKPMYTRAVVPL